MGLYAVIMAGGGGTRLWPKSRENFPKQMHAFIGDKPLVQAMTERLCGIVGQDNVFIIANVHHAQMIREAEICADEAIFIDPYRRDTAPCIGLAATYISRMDPKGVIGIFPSDHYIEGEAEFAQSIRAAYKLAEEGRVVTIGINPTGPETGYGYIQVMPEFSIVEGCQVHRARRFVEKPDFETAKAYVASGDYVWNSGMFVWSVPTILSLFKQHLPDMYERLMRIREAVGTPEEREVLDREYEAMQRISVDYGIMEKLDDIAVVKATFRWSDIGSWTAVSDIMPKDDFGNAVSAQHVSIDTRNSLVLGPEGKLIATIGLDNVIIVDTDDALLVCSKDRAQDVKKLVETIKNQGMQQFL